MKAALYLRMSSDRSGEELGVTRQREDCVALAAIRGWEVVAEYADNDTSAAGKVKRPHFERMLAAVKRGEIDVVIAWNLDRLTRNRPDTVRLIETGQDAQLVIALARGSDLDMSTPMGRMMADQLAGWARYEIEQKSERHKRANEQRAKKGLPHKGRRAYGYSADGLTINEDEALVLKDIAAKFLNGWTYTQLANYLNENGHQTAMGNRFISVAIRQMLMRVRYNGVREYEGVQYPAAWPAIFDDDTFARIQYQIRQRSASINFRPQARTFLLTGLLTCGTCGGQMNGGTTYDRKTNEPRKTYRCNRLRGGCGRVSRGAVPLEWFIRELICHRLDSDEFTAMMSRASNADVRPLIETRKARVERLEELVDSFADGTLTKAEYKRSKARVEDDIAALDAQMSRYQSQAFDVPLGGGDVVRRAWAENASGWRRGLVDLLVEGVTVNPTRKLPRIKIDGKTFYFASDAVDIAWRY